MLYQFSQCNGQLVSSTQSLLTGQERGVQLGDGLFETLRLYQGKALQFNDHWTRLSCGAKQLKIKVPLSKAKVRKNIIDLLRANDLAGQDLGLRITLIRGEGQRGLLPTANEPSLLFMHLFSLPSPYDKGLRLHVSQIRKNDSSPLTRIKSINYLDNILACIEAEENNADDALFLNTHNYITETTLANIFIIANQTLYTPPINDGVLPGISRKVIFELSKQLAIPLHERSICSRVKTHYKKA